MGTTYVTDPAEYRNVASFIEFPDFFPETIDDYTVNAYSYTLYSYFEVNYEIFLDITVSKEQFDTIIDKAKTYAVFFDEYDAYYAEGYKEIVFDDSFSVRTRNSEKEIKSAYIRKVIYNPQTYNIVFENFNKRDVYYIADVAYFNRFGIDPVTYETEIARRQSQGDTGTHGDGSLVS